MLSCAVTRMCSYCVAAPRCMHCAISAALQRAIQIFIRQQRVCIRRGMARSATSDAKLWHGLMLISSRRLIAVSSCWWSTAGRWGMSLLQATCSQADTSGNSCQECVLHCAQGQYLAQKLSRANTDANCYPWTESLSCLLSCIVCSPVGCCAGSKGAGMLPDPFLCRRCCLCLAAAEQC